MMETYFPEMQRIKTGQIEPELDQSWSDLVKIQWEIAVLRVDTGLVLNAGPGHSTRNGVEIPNQIALWGNGWGFSPVGFHACWNFISGISAGARMAQADMRHSPDGREASE